MYVVGALLLLRLLNWTLRFWWFSATMMPLPCYYCLRSKFAHNLWTLQLFRFFRTSSSNTRWASIPPLEVEEAVGLDSGLCAKLRRHSVVRRRLLYADRCSSLAVMAQTVVLSPWVLNVMWTGKYWLNPFISWWPKKKKISLNIDHQSL